MESILHFNFTCFHVSYDKYGEVTWRKRNKHEQLPFDVIIIKELDMRILCINLKLIREFCHYRQCRNATLLAILVLLIKKH